MGDAIKHGLANLANFAGKDNRPTFWWWVLFVVVVTFGINMIASIGFVASSVGGAMSAAAQGADEAQIEVEMMQSMADGLVTQSWVGIVISFLALALIIAAFARRIRDAGLPAFLAIIPVITAVVSSYFSIQLVQEMSQLMAAGDLNAVEEMTATSATTGLLGWLGYLVVIGLGLMPSKST